MPIFQETADPSRDLRILPSLERPLPRLTPPPKPEDAANEKYEVVIIGAGPAGLMLTLLLARLGLSKSIACFDAKPGTLKAGQADGLQPRTLEVLKSLDLVDEILNHGCHLSEVAFWNPKSENSGSGERGIERTSFVPDVVVPARYQHEVTIHQGRIERILEDNLNLYAAAFGGGSSTPIIRRSSRFVSFSLDTDTDSEYPVHISISTNAPDGSVTPKTVYAKHLVGADGAHSLVRRAMGLQLHGETTDHIWGVVDFVADSDFPDLRKRCAIHSDVGSVMIIPRERIASGEFLTRLYVQVKEEVPVLDSEDLEARIKRGNRRAAITLESILEQARRVLVPYLLGIKVGTVVDWWAAYQIGQRMASEFAMKDANGLERVFIVGDACHTHSPKAGQGMNVSMMDSYNLAWKLAHHLHGLSPSPISTTPAPTTITTTNTQASILATYSHERLTIARQLIDFDTKFSTMFSGQIGSSDADAVAAEKGLTHEEFLAVFSNGSGFTSGCGIEYPEGTLIQSAADFAKSPTVGTEYLQGILRPGRRLLDTVVRRYADANLRHLQDDFPSTGRFRILMFLSRDLKIQNGVSQRAVVQICSEVLPCFAKDVVELVVLHPCAKRSFEWTDLPGRLKQWAEVRFHGRAAEDVYGIHGVDESRGAVVVVRPDGYVGVVAALADAGRIREYLRGCVVMVN